MQMKRSHLRVRSRRVLNIGISVPMELGWITLLVCGCVYQPGSSPNTGILCRFLHICGHDQLLTPFPVPLPFLEHRM